MTNLFVSHKLSGMAEPSRLYQLLETHLQVRAPNLTLAAFVAARRPHTSWDKIAEELATLTNVPVSGEALRLWLVDRITVEARVA